MTVSASDELLRRWQHEGDRQALDDLLRRELPRLRARIEREGQGLSGPSVGATDAVQEAARKLIERQGGLSFTAPAPLRAFLWVSARRFLIDRFRRRRRKRALEDETELAEPSGQDGQGEVAAEVLAALRSLEYQQREVLELAYLHGMELAELARELGISTDAARMRLGRARDRLREVCDERRRASLRDGR